MIFSQILKFLFQMICVFCVLGSLFKTTLALAEESNANKDYYLVLGVAEDATEDEIRIAYRRLIGHYHTDRNSAPDAKEKTQEIIQAHRVLGNLNARAAYDQARRPPVPKDISPYQRLQNIKELATWSIEAAQKRGLSTESPLSGLQYIERAVQEITLQAPLFRKTYMEGDVAAEVFRLLYLATYSYVTYFGFGVDSNKEFNVRSALQYIKDTPDYNGRFYNTYNARAQVETVRKYLDDKIASLFAMMLSRVGDMDVLDALVGQSELHQDALLRYMAYSQSKNKFFAHFFKLVLPKYPDTAISLVSSAVSVQKDVFNKLASEGYAYEPSFLFDPETFKELEDLIIQLNRRSESVDKNDTAHLLNILKTYKDSILEYRKAEELFHSEEAIEMRRQAQANSLLCRGYFHL